MQFSDSSLKQGIVEDIDFLVGTDSTKFSTANKVRSVNERFRMIWSIIFESYGGWFFMDDNVSDASSGLPYADQTITNNLGLYALPTGALTVQHVEILTVAGGAWQRILPITYEDFIRIGADGRFTANGTPLYYILQGDIVRLLPIPNFTLASALRVYFAQDISAFAASDTTKAPGFASPFHRMLSIGAALDYAILNGQQTKANNLQAMWNDYERRLRSFYSKRFMARGNKNITPGEDLAEEFR